MILQFNPPIPVTTPKGKALAQAIINDGPDHDIYWICFQDSTGESWVYPNSDIRAQRNIPHGRENISPFYDPDDVAFESDSSENIDYKSMYEDLTEKYIKSCKEFRFLQEDHNELNRKCNRLQELKNDIEKELNYINYAKKAFPNQTGID